VALESRMVLPKVVLDEVGVRPEASCQEPAPQRAIRDEPDPELAHGREDLLLRIARPERVLTLHRRDRMCRMGATDGARGRLRQSEEAHLARLDELAHGAHRL